MAGSAVLRNRYLEATIRGGIVAGLRAAPDGSGKMRPAQFLRDLRPELWEPTPRTQVTVNRARTAATITPLQVYEARPVRVEGGGARDRADRLTPGGTLSQTFRVPEGAVFDAVAARVPTWQTKTSGATLRLYRGEALLAERRIRDAADNAWQEVRPPEPLHGPGEYRLELGDPIGEIGWWGRDDDAYPGGQAYRDGAPVDGDRTLRADVRAEAGEGTLRVSLAGTTLTIDAQSDAPAAPDGGGAAGALPWRWRASW
ncbi:MAG TPA: hypothetical protein VM490_05605 [Armatimonadaceae bacterium]|nr:hypothetical protein [Armatimonadaceae bacterium]